MRFRLAILMGWSVLFALVLPTPATAVLDVPAAITLAVYDEASDSIRVEWTNAESDVVDPGVVVSVSHDVTIAGPTSGSGTASPVVVANPASGDYTVTVTATETTDGVVTDTSTDTETLTVPEPPPDPEPPSPPAVTTAVSGQDVTVSWGAAAENGSPITGYKITLNGVERTRGAGVRSVTFSDVAPGSHTAQVVAESAAGDSGAGEAQVTVAQPVTIPAAPRNVSRTVDGTSVTIRWDAPVVTNNNAATSYEVRLGSGATQVVSGTAATFTNLTPGPFEFTVQSINSAGEGGSASGSFTVATPASAPGTPPNVTASPSGDSVTISWGRSAANGSTIVGYRIALSPAGGTTAQTLGVGARTATFNDLPDGNYTVSVRAQSSDQGNSGNGTATFTIDDVRRPNAPGGVSASASDQTVTVTWNAAQANNSPVTGYRVTVAGQSQDVGAAARSAVFSNVPAGGHTVRVVAKSAVGDSDAGTASVTSSIPLTTPSGPPTGLSASVEGSGVAISWSAPTVTANNAADIHVVTLDTGLAQTVRGTTASFAGLAPGNYTFTVESRNDAGSGGSTVGSFSIRSVPSPPVAVAVEPAGRELTVTWAPPETDGNSPIVDYIVTLSDGDVVVVLVGEPLEAEFTNLELGEYSAVVVARNDVGGSEAAASALVTTVRPFEPFETEEAFIAQQYRDFLGREADGPGLAFWKGATANDRSNVDEIIEAFMKSEEFAPRRSIARLYLAFFDRAPDQGGFDFWADEIGASRATLDTVSESFVGSTEFQDTYGLLSDADFIALVYNNVLIRQPDAAGYDYWLAQMAAGLTRGELMTEFSESPEFVAATKPAVDVIVTYRGMLNRAPDTDGFRFWVVEIAGDPDSLQALIKGFFFTAEYATRVVPEFSSAS